MRDHDVLNYTATPSHDVAYVNTDGVLWRLAVVGVLGSYKAMASQVLSQPHVKEGFGTVLLDSVYEAFQLPYMTCMDRWRSHHLTTVGVSDFGGPICSG